MSNSKLLNDTLYWGSHHHLYEPLTAAEVQTLEEAIFARRLGRFQEARQIWDEKLPPHYTVLVLAIEKAGFEGRLMRHKARLEILETALASQAKWRERPSEQEIKLLTMLAVATKVEANGSLRSALLEARKIKGSWHNRPLEEWSPIELTCATVYIEIMKQCKTYSNWLDPQNDALLPESWDGSPWDCIHAIQLVLIQANDMYGCLSLLPAEQELRDKKPDLTRLFEFVDIFEAKLPSGRDQTKLILINARLRLAQNLLKLERHNEFDFQLMQVESVLNTLSWIRQSDAPVLWSYRLKVLSKAPPNMAYLSVRLDLAAKMRESGDTLQETSVLLDIHLILNGVDQLEREPTWAALNDANMGRFNEIDYGTGGNALSVSHQLSRFGFTDRSITTAGEYLHHLKLFESRFSSFDVPYHRLFLYNAAVDAAQKVGNKDLELSFGAKLSSAWASCPVNSAFTYWRYRGKDPIQWPLDFSITLLEWMKLDHEKGSLTANDVARLLLLDQRSTSYETIATDLQSSVSWLHYAGELVDRMYGIDVPVDASIWELHFGRYERWLWNSPSEVERSLRHTILLDMQQVRNSTLLYYHFQKNTPSDLVNHELHLNLHLLRIVERSRMAELRKRVDKDAVGANQADALLDEWHVMSLKNGLANSVKAVQDGILKDEDLLEVQIWMEKVLPQFPVFFKKQRMITLSTIAQAMYHRYTIFGTLTPDAALDAYARQDETYIGLRRERSILRGSSNLTARAQISPYFGDSDHYIKAMACCVEALGPARLQTRMLRIMGQGQRRDPVPTPVAQRSNDSLMRELFDWAQKRKARSVIEVLGAEIIIPPSILAALDGDHDATGLLRKEVDLQMELESGLSDPVEVSKKLDHVRNEMRDYPSLEQVMDLRDGKAITSTQLQTMGQELGPRVVMVDYVYIPSSSTALGNEILCMVYKNGVHHKSNWIQLDLNYAAIKDWVVTFLEETEPLSTDEASKHLAMLCPLITDAVEASEPGDTILLCPTGILFNIPFHAIPTNDQPLIERNPVVYAQSLSIFRICAISASSLKADSFANPLAVQALSEAESALPSAPAMAFAHRIGARLLSGPALTKSSFLEAITQSTLINFYGHVCFDDSKPPEESKPLDNYIAIRGVDAERVTARDIFDIRLRSGAHVNLIGCQSGRSEVRKNDDQLGLSTALLHAGAGSILSTLWKIRKEDAHEFQEAFYEEISRQLRKESRQQGHEGDADPVEQVLNLAKALQEAMLRVSLDRDGVRKAPYHWAAFMLQGIWNAIPMASLRGKQ